jgi:hypothetical protein
MAEGLSARCWRRSPSIRREISEETGGEADIASLLQVLDSGQGPSVSTSTSAGPDTVTAPGDALSGGEIVDDDAHVVHPLDHGVLLRHAAGRGRWCPWDGASAAFSTSQPR